MTHINLSIVAQWVMRQTSNPKVMHENKFIVEKVEKGVLATGFEPVQKNILRQKLCALTTRPLRPVVLPDGINRSEFSQVVVWCVAEHMNF